MTISQPADREELVRSGESWGSEVHSLFSSTLCSSFLVSLPPPLSSCFSFLVSLPFPLSFRLLVLLVRPVWPNSVHSHPIAVRGLPHPARRQGVEALLHLGGGRKGARMISHVDLAPSDGVLGRNGSPDKMSSGDRWLTSQSYTGPRLKATLWSSWKSPNKHRLIVSLGCLMLGWMDGWKDE